MSEEQFRKKLRQLMREERWPRYYIPDPEPPHALREVDLFEWSHWFGTADRQVAFTGNDHKWVSTVCLGLDHRAIGRGPPLVFESMAFRWNGAYHPKGSMLEGQPVAESLDCERYSSWDDAETGHKAMVRKHLVDQKTRTKVEE